MGLRLSIRDSDDELNAHAITRPDLN